ncbi:hypothetical protein ACWEPB_26680 [Kitasatospora cineracea]
MSTDPAPTGRRRRTPRPLRAGDETVFDEILALLGEQLGDSEPTQPAAHNARKVKVTVEYEPRRATVHDMAGDDGYALASRWFTRLLAQLAIAKSITKSELCVFLYVASGQTRGSGVTAYTQQQITDGLNEIAVLVDAPRITRSTVNRAIRSLCEYGWIDKLRNGAVQINVRLWFAGNSQEQQTVLTELQNLHGTDPQAFPNHVGPPVVADQLLLPVGDDKPAAPARKKRAG